MAPIHILRLPSAILLRLPLCLIIHHLLQPIISARPLRRLPEGQPLPLINLGRIRVQVAFVDIIHIGDYPLIIARLFFLLVVLLLYRHYFVNWIFPADPLLHMVGGPILDYAVCRYWGKLLVWVEEEWDDTRREWGKVQVDMALGQARVAWAEQLFEKAAERRAWREGRIEAALRGLAE
jgi:hypothetical protein